MRRSLVPFLLALLHPSQWPLAVWACSPVYPYLLREVKSCVLCKGFLLAQELWPQTSGERSSPQETWRQVMALCPQFAERPVPTAGAGRRKSGTAGERVARGDRQGTFGQRVPLWPALL